MVTYYSRSGLSLSHVSLIVTTTKGYPLIVASNSSNEDAMLCVLMWIFEAGAISLEALEGVHQQSLGPQLQARPYSWYPKVISHVYEKVIH